MKYNWYFKKAEIQPFAFPISLVVRHCDIRVSRYKTLGGLPCGEVPAP